MSKQLTEAQREAMTRLYHNPGKFVYMKRNVGDALVRKGFVTCQTEHVIQRDWSNKNGTFTGFRRPDNPVLMRYYSMTKEGRAALEGQE